MSEARPECRRLFFQLGDGGSGATFILWSLVEFLHVWARFQKVRDHLLQNSHAVSMYYADAAGGGHDGGVQELLHTITRLLSVFADDVDLLKRRIELRRRLE